MDAVVLHSDVARLVLGYLKRQNLERASHVFCRTSPHLKQELSAYRKGFTPHCFGPNLEDIICEYVNITRTVDEIVSSLSSSLRFQLFERKVSEKVKLLLERTLDTSVKIENSESATLKKSHDKHIPTGSAKLNTDKENTSKKHNKQKRKRGSLVTSSDERKSPVALRNKTAKRRRILEPFCYLSTKKHNLKQRSQTTGTSSTGDEQTQTDDGIEAESADEESNELEEENSNVLHNESELSLMEKPNKESTPRNKSAKGQFITPTVPELSQAILDNPHFQMKLVDNINYALNSSTNIETQPAMSNVKTTTAFVPTNAGTLSEEQQIINSNEMLDQMVKDILKATESDPAFDAIIENVVGATTNTSAAVQCNIAETAPPQTQQHFTIVQQQPPQQQHLTLPCLSAVSHETAATTTAPRTPLIIRTAVASANPSLGGVTGACESQVLSALTTNNSFGSLIDPNFSISKLIVLNPNDSAQKQPPSADQSIGNTSTEHLINQLEEAAGDEQVYFDANTGQLTIPLFLTDEGLLANFPFLVNNEAITQQLQPDNICNMDGSRIEIPLPEPIIVSADQLPPNSIILTSAQKAITVEEQRLPGVQQAPRTVVKKPNVGPAAPSSLNHHCSNADDETPSTSGIVNIKAYKSLSTPRRRTSHVRTLSFSPKIDSNRTTVQAVATPLSSRHDIQRNVAAADEVTTFSSPPAVPEKAIIKNVEILPRLDGPIDVSANESSNSCNVPPLFVTEESSNQTVIKTELSLRENKEVAMALNAKSEINTKSTIAEHSDTPKRKQVRKTAVRACKRQLSKSSDESDKPKIIIPIDKDKPKEKPAEGEEQAKEQQQKKLNDDKMMEEWLRLRNATTSDLDLRLRQLNAEQYAAVPKSMRRNKTMLQQKRKTRRRIPVISKRMRKRAAALAMQMLEKETSNLEDSVAVAETEMANESDAKPKAELKEIKEKKLKSKSGPEKKRSSKDRSMEFNIKIPTPQKDKRESHKKKKTSSTENVNAESATEEASETVANTAPHKIPPTQPAIRNTEHERDRRTANIACILETPFKAPTTLGGDVPPTPGMPNITLDTPASKLCDAPLSTSYLFGSLTKSELATPQLSAVTPGFHFTPFGSSRDVTPRSIGPATDYSSGGSYYKPDESDDLDRNFDQILRDSAQKRKEEAENAKILEQHSRATDIKNLLFEEKTPPPLHSAEPKEDAICVEISAEKLRVEPIVLKRIKSFGAESTENGEGANAALNVAPHYTLVSELPEICAEEESSNSSSTFSSSSSSSSDSSSSSSSSSSDTSVASQKDEATTSAEQPQKSTDNLVLSLDNLSSISSTEDEEWQKLAVTEEENSQLVSNDGEVRYPVRSWLTPSKVNNPTTASAEECALATKYTVTVPLKSAEKRNRLEEDLQQKRERMMEKLKKDANQRRDKQSNVATTPPSGITAALSATRKIAAMREKAKSQSKNVAAKSTTSSTSQSNLIKSAAAVEEKRTLEVLTALQLSARKHQPTSVGESKMPTAAALAPPMSALDDNATSTLFSTTSKSTTTTYELSDKTDRLPLNKLISQVKAKQRQCQQIEPLPVLKTKRTSGVGRKKIVRNPLGFKSALPPDPAEVVEQIEEVKSPIKLTTKSTVELGDKSRKSAVITPIPKKKLKTKTGLALIPSSKLRVSPRLQGNKNRKVKDSDIDDDDDEEVETKPLETRKTIKTMRTRPTRAKSLTKVCTKVPTVRTRITKSKKVAQKVEPQASEPELEQLEKATNEGDILKTDPAQEDINAEEMQPDKPEDVAKTEKEMSQKNKDAYRVKEERPTTGKTTKLVSLEAAQLPKNIETTKTTNPTAVDCEVAESIDAMKMQPSKSAVNLPQARLTATEKPETVAASRKNKDITQPTTSTTAKDISEAVIPKAKATKEKFQQIQKDETTDRSKLCSAKISKENIAALERSTVNEFAKQENTCKTGNAQNSDERIATPTSTTNAEATTTETSEDDPLEGCELVSVSDENPINFISVTYDGPNVPPANPLPRRDFSNFKMVVAFDDDEKHIWRITDELMLFHTSPATQQIRNIPKKRKVRINTCVSDQDTATVGVVHSTTTTLATTSATSTITIVSTSDNATNTSKSSREAKPIATSTPISAPAISSTQESSKHVPKVNKEDESKPSTSAASTGNSSAGTTEMIQMDDIESLLSRLHGKAN